MGFSSFWFLDFQKLAFWLQVNPGETLPPPETLKKAGAAEQMRDIKDLRKKCRSRPGADPEQTRSRPGAEAGADAGRLSVEGLVGIRNMSKRRERRHEGARHREWWRNGVIDQILDLRFEGP